MTKKEFITKQETMARALKRPAMLGFILFFVGFLGALFAGSFLDKYKEYTLVGGLVVLGFLALFVTSIWLMIRSTKSQQKKFGTNCPACNKPVTGVGVHIAIATGNCGHCGESVFDNPPLSH